MRGLVLEGTTRPNPLPSCGFVESHWISVDYLHMRRIIVCVKIPETAIIEQICRKTCKSTFGVCLPTRLDYVLKII